MNNNTSGPRTQVSCRRLTEDEIAVINRPPTEQEKAAEWSEKILRCIEVPAAEWINLRTPKEQLILEAMHKAFNPQYEEAMHRAFNN